MHVQCKFKIFLCLVIIALTFGAISSNASFAADEMLELFKMIANSKNSENEEQLKVLKEGYKKEFQLLCERHHKQQDEVVNKEVVVDTKTRNVLTPLICAIVSENKPWIKALIELGADVNQKDQNGSYPIYCAAQVRNSDILEMLLCSKADIMVTDQSGYTPFLLAFDACNFSVAHRLGLAMRSFQGKSVSECGEEVVDLLNEGKILTFFETKRQPLTEAKKEVLSRIISAVNALEPNNLDTKGICKNLCACIREGENFDVILNKTPINSCDQYGRTLLYWACAYGDIDCVKALLKVPGINVNAMDVDGFTPVNVAASAGHADIVCELLKHTGIDVNLCDYKNQATPLHGAAFNYEHVCDKSEKTRKDTVNLATSYFNMIKALLDKGEIDVKITDCEGFAPFDFIADRRQCVDKGIEEKLSEFDVKIIDMLIKKGADVNGCNSISTSGTPILLPIIAAIRNSNKKVVQKLIECGADISKFNSEGRSAFTEAVRCDEEEIFDLLISKPDVDYNVVVKSILIAPSNDDVRVKYLKKVADKGIIIKDSRDKLGNTVFHWAAADCGSKTIDVLKEYGADPNVQNVNGQTALHVAVKYCNAEATETLVQNGADATIADNTSTKPLGLTYLLNFEGPDPRRMQESLKRIRTVLDEAESKCGSGKKLAQIKARRDAKKRKSKPEAKKPANVDKKAAEILAEVKPADTGTSAPMSLHEIVEKGDLDKVKEYLRINCDVNSLNGEGQTPLCVAIIYGHTEIVDFLLKNGADVNISNSEGKLPIRVAIEVNNKFSKLPDKAFSNDPSFKSAISGVSVDQKYKDVIFSKLSKKGKRNPEFYKKLLPGNSFIIDLLLKNGSATAVCDKSLLFYTKNPEIAKLFVKKMDITMRNKLFLDAVKNNNLVAFQALKNEGIDVNTKDANGSTPLHIAATYGWDSVVDQLLKIKKTNVNVLNNDGDTALSLAIKGNKFSVVEKLLRCGKIDFTIEANGRETLSEKCPAKIQTLFEAAKKTFIKQKKTSVTSDIDVQNHAPPPSDTVRKDVLLPGASSKACATSEETLKKDGNSTSLPKPSQPAPDDTKQSSNSPAVLPAGSKKSRVAPKAVHKPEDTSQESDKSAVKPVIPVNSAQAMPKVVQEDAQLKDDALPKSKNPKNKLPSNQQLGDTVSGVNSSTNSFPETSAAVPTSKDDQKSSGKVVRRHLHIVRSGQTPEAQSQASGPMVKADEPEKILEVSGEGSAQPEAQQTMPTSVEKINLENSLPVSPCLPTTESLTAGASNGKEPSGLEVMHEDVNDSIRTTSESATNDGNVGIIPTMSDMSDQSASDFDPLRVAYQLLGAFHRNDVADFRSIASKYRQFSFNFNNTIRDIGKEMLENAVEKNNVDMVKELVKIPGLDGNQQDCYGNTPLHLAVIIGVTVDSVDIVKELAKIPDLNSNQRDCFGNTPLHLAVTMGSVNMVKELVKITGINTNVADFNGQTPLQLACMIFANDPRDINGNPISYKFQDIIRILSN